MSVSAFGVFANDDLAPSNSVHIQQYDNDETYSNGGRAAEIRLPMDDVNPYWEGDSTLSRTLSRTQSFLSTKINADGLAPFTPALTPRTPRVVDTSGRTPRCRDDLTDDVQLELVGTTLVAKSSNESVRLVVSFAHRCGVCAGISPVLFS